MRLRRQGRLSEQRNLTENKKLTAALTPPRKSIKNKLLTILMPKFAMKEITK